MTKEQFIKVPKDILGRRNLTSTTKLAYGHIVDAMRNKGAAWPGVRKIAEGIGRSTAAVQRSIKQIEEAGLLEIQHGGDGKCNQYRQPNQNRTHFDDASALETSTVPEKQSALETSTSVLETSTEAHSKRVPKKTRRNKKTTTCRASASTDSKSANNKSDHQSLIEHFTDRWSEIIGGGATYPFAGVRDGKAAKTILGAVAGDLERAKSIVDLFLADDDPWLVENGEGRGLALLASRARLTKYLAGTATRRPQGRMDEDSAEHPLIADGREKWPDDVAGHPEEWRALAMAVEAGDILGNAVIISDAESGEDFRAEHNQELARVAN